MSDITHRPTPEQVVEGFIAAEVGFHTPGMAGQSADLIDALREHGCVIVHPDDVPTAHEASPSYQAGWNDCRRHIFGDDA